MAKGKAKINRREDLSQTRTLRSRKRESPNDESSLTDDVQTALHQNGTEEEDISGPPHYSLQDCAVIIHQHQPVEPSCIPKQEDPTKEKHAEMTNVNATDVAVPGQEDTNIINPNNDPQLESCAMHPEKDTDQRGENGNKSPNHNCINQFQVCSPIFKDDEQSTSLELQIFEKANYNLEKNQDTKEDKSSIFICDVKETTIGFPVKKKRRMGLFGLTEKERSQFLQTPKLENGQCGNKRAEKPICDETGISTDLDENVSLPSTSINVSAGFITELSQNEPQSSHSRENHLADPEVHIAVTVSDQTGVLCDAGSSEGKQCGAEEDSLPGPDLTENPESHQQKEEDDGQKLQECKETTAENPAEMPENQMENEDESVSCSSAITSNTNQTESDRKDATEADVPHIRSVSRTSDEEKVEMVDDGAVGAADVHSVELNCSLKLCEASLTHVVPDLKYNVSECGPEDNPGAGPSAEWIQTSNPEDLFGSDYVSDSQLNTIVLIDEKIVDREEPDHFGWLDDETDLICGLIGELSSLNRNVMVAHRKLANLRRKYSRCSKR